jgi:molybdopterin-binding protein
MPSAQGETRVVPSQPVCKSGAVTGETYSIGAAARALGVSVDTIRRWDRDGRIAVSRDDRNHRVIAEAEVDRLRGTTPHLISARNRLPARVVSVELEGFLARIVLDTTESARVVAVVTREAVEELDLRAGDDAQVILKATSVMVER